MDMPADERLDRWTRMWSSVKAGSASIWCRRFLSALEGTKDVADAGEAEAQPALVRKPRGKRAA
jgi:trehalose-6-phosphate synthase